MTSDVLDPSLWAQLREDPLAKGVVMRRVLPNLTHDVFIGEIRPSRHRVLELSVIGVAANMPKKWRQSKGLEIGVDTSDPTRTKVRLRSLTNLGDPLFVELAAEVVGTLAAFPGSDAATRVVERVIAWQEFFARRGEPFSEEQAAGLFGELTVLGDYLLPELGSSTAVYGWTGPDPSLQDYQFSDVALEIKTYRGSGAGQMKISSERQLEHIGVTDLYLGYVSLDERQDGTGQSLIELIDQLRSLLSDSPAAAHLFEGKLLSCGWQDSHSEFRTERYVPRAVEFFLVTGGFPRLVASELPTGLSYVTYVIERSALDPHLTASDAVIDHLRTKTCTPKIFPHS
ncbi:PD-(D/E)XK motif protein [Nocardioides sp. YJ-D4]